MHNTQLSTLIHQRLGDAIDYKPLILSPHCEDDRPLLSALRQSEQVLVCDALASQLGELLKIRRPQQRFSLTALTEAIQAHLGTTDPADYGVWVYYPWSRRLVHTLTEAEFIQVRTNRNLYKITPDEQRQLLAKRIGIIGLSVGHAIALTLATERTCGELRLADFDLLELSNLNRVRTGIHHLGVPKVVVAAREIAEIDPFLPVTCFHEGATEANLDAFLHQGGRLDLLIEECDGLDVKVLARLKARAAGIPMLMSTSDRGMLDVERFDREPQRAILHGLIDHLDATRLQNLTTEEKVPYILAMLGIETVSQRGKASMLEVEQSITTWPQLASAVALGGALVGDVARRLLLDQYHDSGRYYVDLEALVQNRATMPPATNVPAEVRQPLTAEAMAAIVSHQLVSAPANGVTLDDYQITRLVEAATLAPSGGNRQPWQWFYQAGVLYLFHDPSQSMSLDFQETASYLALGAATENLVLQAHALDLQVRLQPLIGAPGRLVAAFTFHRGDYGDVGQEAHVCDVLVRAIPLRLTNRILGPRQPLDPALLQTLTQIGQTILGAQLTWLTGADDLAEFAAIAGAAERLRIFNQQGHHDFVHEIRWTTAEAAATRDGIDLATLDLTLAEQAGLTVARAWPVVADLKQWGGGGAIAKLTHKTIAAASAVGLLTMPQYSLADFFAGGRALQRVWLTATEQGLAFQPVASAIFLFARLRYGQGVGLDQEAIAELTHLRQRFIKLFPIVDKQQGEILLFRLAVADTPTVRALRRPVEQVLTIHP
ncbi:MAG: Rv1355c family protein [Caldilineaceae bacterium]